MLTFLRKQEDISPIEEEGIIHSHPKLTSTLDVSYQKNTTPPPLSPTSNGFKFTELEIDVSANQNLAESFCDYGSPINNINRRQERRTIQGSRRNSNDVRYYIDPDHVPIYSLKRLANYALGRGSSATVYKTLMFDTLLVCAEKVVVMADPAKRVQLVRELKSLKKTVTSNEKCPYIVQLYDVIPNPSDGTLSICLEFMDGGSLQDLVSAGGCKDERVLHGITQQLLMGLSFLHSLKILHRDIKPSNALISSSGVVKLADFGLSRILETEVSMADSFVGTFHFMAPERMSGGNYSFQSDVWSIGLTIHTVALGKYPYDVGKGFWSILSAVHDKPVPLPSSTEFSSHFLDFIVKACTYEAASRPSAAILLQHDFLTAPSRNLYNQKDEAHTVGVDSSTSSSRSHNVSPQHVRSKRSSTTVLPVKIGRNTQSEDQRSGRLIRVDSLLRSKNDLLPPIGSRVSDAPAVTKGNNSSSERSALASMGQKERTSSWQRSLSSGRLSSRVASGNQLSSRTLSRESSYADKTNALPTDATMTLPPTSGTDYPPAHSAAAATTLPSIRLHQAAQRNIDSKSTSRVGKITKAATHQPGTISAAAIAAAKDFNRVRTSKVHSKSAIESIFGYDANALSSEVNPDAVSSTAERRHVAVEKIEGTRKKIGSSRRQNQAFKFSLSEIQSIVLAWRDYIRRTLSPSPSSFSPSTMAHRSYDNKQITLLFSELDNGTSTLEVQTFNDHASTGSSSSQPAPRRRSLNSLMSTVDDSFDASYEMQYEQEFKKQLHAQLAADDCSTECSSSSPENQIENGLASSGANSRRNRSGNAPLESIRNIRRVRLICEAFMKRVKHVFVPAKLTALAYYINCSPIALRDAFVVALQSLRKDLEYCLLNPPPVVQLPRILSSSNSISNNGLNKSPRKTMNRSHSPLKAARGPVSSASAGINHIINPIAIGDYNDKSETTDASTGAARGENVLGNGETMMAVFPVPGEDELANGRKISNKRSNSFGKSPFSGSSSSVSTGTVSPVAVSSNVSSASHSPPTTAENAVVAIGLRRATSNNSLQLSRQTSLSSMAEEED